MKYKTYSEIPEKEKFNLSGIDIKYSTSVDDMEIYIIKDNVNDHKVYYPYDELDDNSVYKVFKDYYISGSGICYGKIFIFI